MSNNAHDLSNRLLNALDNNYNVVDMQAVNEIISILEKFNITKELLETTRLGKHVNELRRKTTDPTLARRAKVLVKRWRDLVIPTVASPGHNVSNRSSAERQVRRLGGTPLTSPALSRVVSPAVNSPRPPSRPAWGGYESDSQDVILVDDDPPPPAPLAPLAPPTTNAAHKPLTPPVKRPTSPVAVHDEKKAKRDKKPKKRRGHSRAGSGTEATGGDTGAATPPAPAAAPPAAPANWGARNGSSERRRNGYRREKIDPYAALVNKLPPAGAKKVKTTQELLEEIQSRGAAPAHSPPRDDTASPDVVVIDDIPAIKIDSPLRNGASPGAPASPAVPLEDAREHRECTCTCAPAPACPAAPRAAVRPHHVLALHHALLPGINGTRAPLYPHKFAVRPARDPSNPELFSSVVPLYNYSDYADDYCAKNMYRVPLCTHIPSSEFAPAPPSPPPRPAPPPPRPYPLDPDPGGEEMELDVKEELFEEERPSIKYESIKIEPEAVGAVGAPAGSDRLKPPLLAPGDDGSPPASPPAPAPAPPELFAPDHPEHRTVEKTKELLRPELNGQVLFDQCRRAIESIPYDYEQLRAAPEITLPVGAEHEAECEQLVTRALGADTSASAARDELGRPARPLRFAEWHECARLGELVALPYVVID